MRFKGEHRERNFWTKQAALSGLAILSLALLASLLAGGGGNPTSAGAAPGSLGANGVLPCGKRIVLTATYRTEGVFRFEGVADLDLVGQTVRIYNLRDELVVKTEVAPDGTFWATADATKHGYTWLSKFVAIADGSRSRWRRLGQAVGLRSREPIVSGRKRDGETFVKELTRIKVKVTGEEPALVVVGRQIGCSRYEVLEQYAVITDPNGLAELNLPRPATGRPYGIYRVSTEDDFKISPPIVVKPTP